MIRRVLLRFFLLSLSIVLLLGLATPGMGQGLLMPDLGHPALQGLVGWWRALPGFTGSTQLYNLVRGGLHGTLTNMGFSIGSGWSPSTRPGGYAQLNFSGISDYVSLGDDPLYNFVNTTFTALAWFRATVCSGGCYLMAKRVGETGVCTPSCGGWFLRVNADGTLEARIQSDSNVSAGDRVTVSTTNLTGQWHHVAVVFTTDTLTLANNDVTVYVDGVLDQQGRTDSGGDPYGALVGWPLMLGTLADQQAGSFFTGSLDGVQLYNRGLTAPEVWQRYQHGLTGDRAVFQQSQPLVGTLLPASNTGAFFPFFH